jgi:hypothetical protein
VAILVQLGYGSVESSIEAWHDCYISKTKKTGYVATLRLAKKRKSQKFYGLNDLNQLLKKAEKRHSDVYLSLNAFDYGSRKAKSLKQIRNIGVDIDCYKVDLTIAQAVEEIKNRIVQGIIPNPNLLIHSGRGLQLVYSIAGGAAPAMLFLSRYITTQYIAALKDLGADTSATDPSRVFRLPGSINSKNGKQVTVDTWRKLEYSLEELYSFCTPLEKKRRPRKRKDKLTTLPAKKGLKNLYSLNTARKDDLEMLVQLRKGAIERRNVLTYIYTYTIALIVKNKAAALEFALQLNDRITDPQPVKEVQRTAGNAYDDAMKFFGEFQKRGYKMWYKHNDGIKRPMKNENIIKELEITAAEMSEMTTIIGKGEKRERDKAYHNKKRREQGVLPREEYLELEQKNTEKQIEFIREQLAANPKIKQKELAEMLGVTQPRVSHLMKKFKI